MEKVKGFEYFPKTLYVTFTSPGETQGTTNIYPNKCRYMKMKVTGQTFKQTGHLLCGGRDNALLETVSLLLEVFSSLVVP